METTSNKKENNQQITAKNKALYSSIKEYCISRGNIPMGKGLIEVADKGLEKIRAEKETIEKKVVSEKEISKKDSIVTELEISFSEKIDVLAEAINKLIASKDEVSDEEFQTQVSNAIEEAVVEHEDILRSLNLMFVLPQPMKTLVYSLLDFRKSRKEKYSENVEQLFLSMFKTYVDESSDSFPDGFKKEFNKQFKEYFTVKPVDQIEKEIEAIEEPVSSTPFKPTGIGML
jgi:hypothetical protein